MEIIQAELAVGKVCRKCKMWLPFENFGKYGSGTRSICKQCRRVPFPKMRGPIATMQEHFWKRVDKSGVCWEWTGQLVGIGYGKFSHGTKGNVKCYRAHRLVWEWTYGPIPDGMLVLHECDNPRCVNPAHLKLGSQQDNMSDKVARDRCCKGDAHWTRKHPEKLKALWKQRKARTP